MIVFITGATAGFGKAIATLFAKNNYPVIITGRRKERLAALEAELREKYKVRVLSLCFDVRNFDEVQTAIASLPPEWKEVGILVNNAGLAAGFGPIQNGLVEDWECMIDTNIKGLLYMTRQIVPGMIERKKGHIINIGSIAGKEVYANGNVYCATKFAVDALNKAMRIDLLQHHIKVSSISPGLAESEFSIVRYKGDLEKAKQVYAGVDPLTPDDIAETVFWVATRPAHVNILDITLTAEAQANTTTPIRRKA
ncbi:MAG: SDR family NAD(P)-dependent oxidoreductase [Bacteroidia bacterium]